MKTMLTPPGYSQDITFTFRVLAYVVFAGVVDGVESLIFAVYQPAEADNDALLLSVVSEWDLYIRSVGGEAFAPQIGEYLPAPLEISDRTEPIIFHELPVSTTCPFVLKEPVYAVNMLEGEAVSIDVTLDVQGLEWAPVGTHSGCQGHVHVYMQGRKLGRMLDGTFTLHLDDEVLEWEARLLDSSLSLDLWGKPIYVTFAVVTNDHRAFTRDATSSEDSKGVYRSSAIRVSRNGTLTSETSR
jgi:hypothetical protein